MRALSTAVFEVRDCSPRQPKHTLLGMSWVQVTVNLAKEAKNEELENYTPTGQICSPSEFLKIEFYWNRVTSICSHTVYG